MPEPPIGLVHRPSDPRIDLDHVWADIEAMTWKRDTENAIALMRHALPLVDRPPDEFMLWMPRWARWLKDQGDLDHAVEVMTLAVPVMERFPAERFTIEPFLRLPAYLAEAGRSQEAWLEFERRLQWVRATMPRPGRWFYESAVRDKMRLFLQRAGRHREAVEHGLLAHLLRAQGLFERARRDELDIHRSRPAINRAVASLLRKSGDTACTEVVSTVLEEAEHGLPSADHDALIRRVRAILATDHTA